MEHLSPLSLTEFHLYKILSLVDFDIEEQKPSPTEILNLPIRRLRGLSEKEENKLIETIGFQTIEDLANCELVAAEIAVKTEIPKNKIDRWLRISGLLRRLTSGEITTPKIVLAGLNNAGKTSIILTMKRVADKVSKEDRLKEIEELRPTKGVERQKIVLQGQPMTLFDMGGQKKYRDRYLETPERYLDGTDLFIFVVDTQDQERFTEATKYFENLAKEIYKLELDPTFAVFFHKIDDDLPEDSELWKIMDDQTSLLRATLQGIWKDRPTPSFEMKMVFQTSILREYSVFSGVSDGLKFISPVQDILHKVAQETAKTLDTDMLLLVADTGLELARFQADTAEFLEDVEPHFLYEKTLRKVTEMQENSVLYPISINKEKMFHIISSTMVEEKPIYLSYLSCKDTPPIQGQIEEIIGETFLPWIANYFEKI